MTCKICSSDKYQIIGKPRLYKDFPISDISEYKIAQCDQCKFYFLQPEIKLKQDEWSLLYEDEYFTNYNITKWQRKIHIHERITRLDLISSHSSIENGPFLDIGCGEGFVLEEALSQGYQPYGVDIADNLNHNLDTSKIHFYNGNIHEAEFEDNFFSVIYMDSVLEHVLDPLATLRELHRVLKPKGVLFLIVPNEDCLLNDVKKLLYTLAMKPDLYGRIKPFVPPYHINGFNSKSLKYALTVSGFHLLNLSQFGGDYAFWRAYKFLSLAYFREWFLYPFSLLSIPLKKQIQLQVLCTK